VLRLLPGSQRVSLTGAVGRAVPVTERGEAPSRPTRSTPTSRRWIRASPAHSSRCSRGGERDDDGSDDDDDDDDDDDCSMATQTHQLS